MKPTTVWIAKIIKNRQEIAVLRDDGIWLSPIKEIAAYLNLRFNPKRATGVGAVLPFGHLAAQQAAIPLEGEAVFAQPSAPITPGTIS